ncbi:MAG: hypothetical protein LBP67_01795 [Bacteroidales bacterium]|nr:hypothetical protein [Bacteroidales bacterium]
MSRIDELIKNIHEEKTERAVQRRQYNCQLSEIMRLVTAIGKDKFPHFVIDNKNRFTYENTLLWLIGQNFKCLNPNDRSIIDGNLQKGIYIAGSTGSGKSILLEIICEVALRIGILFGYGDDIKMLTGNCVRAQSICDEFKDSGEIKAYKEAPILFIQDLGAEQTETMFMGNRNNVLREILEHRGDNKRCITLITSNNMINDNDNIAKYGDRVISRLREMCNYFVLTGADRRN